MANLANIARNFVPAAQVTNQKDRQPSKFWLNIGFIAADGSFVEIKGLGRAFDHVEALKGPKDPTSRFGQEAAAAKAVLTQLKEFAASTAPGTAMVLGSPSIGELAIQFRHAEAKDEISAEENPLSINFLDLVKTAQAS